MELSTPSKSAVDRAGRLLRDDRTWTDPDRWGPLAHSVMILDQWRSGFAPALNAATIGLRSAVLSCGLPADRFEVKGRHKKQPAIVDKLRRGSTRLSQMEDIAGCRAVVPTLDDLNRVREQIVNRATSGRVVRVDDYISSPRPGGYWALHLHTLRTVRKGSDILGTWAVELQIRTEAQHGWAENVEAFDNLLGTSVKHEQDDAMAYPTFQAFARYIRDNELGHGHHEAGVRLMNKHMMDLQRVLLGRDH